MEFSYGLVQQQRPPRHIFDNPKTLMDHTGPGIFTDEVRTLPHLAPLVCVSDSKLVGEQGWMTQSMKMSCGWAAVRRLPRRC